MELLNPLGNIASWKRNGCSARRIIARILCQHYLVNCIMLSVYVNLFISSDLYPKMFSRATKGFVGVITFLLQFPVFLCTWHEGEKCLLSLNNFVNPYFNTHCWPGSSVGIVTDYGLDGPGIESRWGRDFPPVQTGPGAHPAPYTMATGSFPGVKCGRGVLLTTHPLLAPGSWKSRAIPLPPSRPQSGL
jgi:hypothetical protein